MKKIGEDRHKLSDLLEENEEDLDGYSHYSNYFTRRTRLSSTGSSMDNLWELHPRRLSEAGLSRHSDTSAVLTEDTDSFIIGDRVWVGGTKPGQIAYIGETQFAPGEWAGIALDQPIGKNDGSVGGIRYFQCEPKRGVFSRLTRLSRVPLNNEGSGDTFANTTNGSVRNSVSPTGSHRSLLKSPTLSNSNTSLASSSAINFKIGDRVIIKSTQGSKIGTVRYIGATQFAPGEWCGVELDDPRGKNDGSIEGIRYFECRPNYGLFSPISKVSKSPSKHKPGTCVVHSAHGMPPSGFRRAGSKESINSSLSLTSAASSARRVRLGVNSLSPTKKVATKTTASTPLPSRTALQDVLREKQQHIEQLLKERDLERAEITRAANQADDAERKLMQLTMEYEQHKHECEIRFKDQFAKLVEIQKERQEYELLLDDEKRRHEDTQFKYEEASIAKGDLEKKLQEADVLQNENNSRILDLEKLINEERERVKLLDADVVKLFESEQMVEKTKEEMDGIKQELESNVRTTKEQLESTRKDLEESRFQLDEERKMKDNIIEELRNEINKITTEYETIKSQHIKEISMYKTKMDESMILATGHDFEIKTLKDNLEQSMQSLKEKEKFVEEISSQTIAAKADLEKEILRLKQDVSGKVLDNEALNEKLKIKTEEFETFKVEYDKLKVSQDNVVCQTDHLADEFKTKEQDYRNQIDEGKKILTATINELANIKNQYETEININKEKIDGLTNANEKYIKEIELLTVNMNDLQAEQNKNFETYSEKHKRSLEEHVSQINTMTTKLKTTTEHLQNTEKTVTSLQTMLDTKSNELNTAQLELDSQKRRLESEIDVENKLITESNNLKLNLGETESQLQQCTVKISELSNENNKLRLEIENLMKTHDTGATLEVLNRELNEKQQRLETIKDELEKKYVEKERQCNEITINLQNLSQNYERQQREYEEKINLHVQHENNFKIKYEEIQNEHKQTTERLTEQLNQLRIVCQEKDKELVNVIQTTTDSQEKAKSHLESLDTERLSEINRCQIRIDTLAKDLAKSSETLVLKTQEIETLEKHVKLLESEGLIKDTTQQDQIGTFNKELTEKIEFIDNLQKQMFTLEQTHSNCNVTFNVKEEENKNLMIEINKLQNEIKTLEEKNDEITKIRDEAVEQIANVTQQVIESTKVVGSKDEEIVQIETKYQQLLSTCQEQEVLLKSQHDESTKLLMLQLEERSKNIERLNNEIKSYQQNCEKSGIDFVNKEKEIDLLREQINEKETVIVNTNKEIEELIKVHADLSSKFNCSSNELNVLFTQVADLTKKATNAEKCVEELQIEKNNYVDLIKKLQLTNKQKNELILLIQNMKNNDNCSDLIKVINDIDVVKLEEVEVQIVELEKERNNMKVAVEEKEKNVRKLQDDLLNMQKELLQSQELIKETNKKDDNKSVRLLTYIDQLKHLTLLNNTMKLQVELYLAQNFVTNISHKYGEIRDYGSKIAKLLNGNVNVQIRERFTIFFTLLNQLSKLISDGSFNLQKNLRDSLINLRKKDILLNVLIEKLRTRDLSSSSSTVTSVCHYRDNRYVFELNKYDKIFRLKKTQIINVNNELKLTYARFNRLLNSYGNVNTKYDCAGYIKPSECYNYVNLRSVLQSANNNYDNNITAHCCPCSNRFDFINNDLVAVEMVVEYCNSVINSNYINTNFDGAHKLINNWNCSMKSYYKSKFKELCNSIDLNGNGGDSVISNKIHRQQIDELQSIIKEQLLTISTLKTDIATFNYSNNSTASSIRNEHVHEVNEGVCINYLQKLYDLKKVDAKWLIDYYDRVNCPKVSIIRIPYASTAINVKEPNGNGTEFNLAHLIDNLKTLIRDLFKMNVLNLLINELDMFAKSNNKPSLFAGIIGRRPKQEEVCFNIPKKALKTINLGDVDFPDCTFMKDYVDLLNNYKSFTKPEHFLNIFTNIIRMGQKCIATYVKQKYFGSKATPIERKNVPSTVYTIQKVFNIWKGLINTRKKQNQTTITGCNFLNSNVNLMKFFKHYNRDSLIEKLRRILMLQEECVYQSVINNYELYLKKIPLNNVIVKEIPIYPNVSSTLTIKRICNNYLEEIANNNTKHMINFKCVTLRDYAKLLNNIRQLDTNTLKAKSINLLRTQRNCINQILAAFNVRDTTETSTNIESTLSGIYKKYLKQLNLITDNVFGNCAPVNKIIAAATTNNLSHDQLPIIIEYVLRNQKKCYENLILTQLNDIRNNSRNNSYACKSKILIREVPVYKCDNKFPLILAAVGGAIAQNILSHLNQHKQEEKMIQEICNKYVRTQVKYLIKEVPVHKYVYIKPPYVDGDDKSNRTSYEHDCNFLSTYLNLLSAAKDLDDNTIERYLQKITIAQYKCFEQRLAFYVNNMQNYYVTRINDVIHSLQKQQIARSNDTNSAQIEDNEEEVDLNDCVLLKDYNDVMKYLPDKSDKKTIFNLLRLQNACIQKETKAIVVQKLLLLLNAFALQQQHLNNQSPNVTRASLPNEDVPVKVIYKNVCSQEAKLQNLLSDMYVNNIDLSDDCIFFNDYLQLLEHLDYLNRTTFPITLANILARQKDCLTKLIKPQIIISESKQLINAMEVKLAQKYENVSHYYNVTSSGYDNILHKCNNITKDDVNVIVNGELARMIPQLERKIYSQMNRIDTRPKNTETNGLSNAALLLPLIMFFAQNAYKKTLLPQLPVVKECITPEIYVHALKGFDENYKNSLLGVLLRQEKCLTAKLNEQHRINNENILLKCDKYVAELKLQNGEFMKMIKSQQSKQTSIGNEFNPIDLIQVLRESIAQNHQHSNISLTETKINNLSRTCKINIEQLKFECNNKLNKLLIVIDKLNSSIVQHEFDKKQLRNIILMNPQKCKNDFYVLTETNNKMQQNIFTLEGKIAKQIKLSEQKSVCQLPKLIKMQNCVLNEDYVKSITFNGYRDDDVAEFKTNLYYTLENVQRCIAANISANYMRNYQRYALQFFKNNPEIFVQACQVYYGRNITNDIESNDRHKIAVLRLAKKILCLRSRLSKCMNRKLLYNCQVSNVLVQKLEKLIKNLMTIVTSHSTNIDSFKYDQSKLTNLNLCNIESNKLPNIIKNQYQLILKLQENLLTLQDNLPINREHQLNLFERVIENLSRRILQLENALLRPLNGNDNNKFAILYNSQIPKKSNTFMNNIDVKLNRLENGLRSLENISLDKTNKINYLYNLIKSLAISKQSNTQKVTDINLINNLHAAAINNKNLRDRLSDKQFSNQQSQINNNVLSNDEHKKLLEEKIFAENQIQFLNSIIADMKKKSDEQKARIEILESGYSATDAVEMQLYGLPNKTIPPRAYCDICEEFDLHETENCPRQCDDDVPATTKDKHQIPSERPYCEFCEVFGHDTQDCQEDQTF